LRCPLIALPAGLAALLVAGCATPPETAGTPAPVAAATNDAPQVVGGRRLTGPEFRQMVFGNTLDRRLPNGSRLLVHIAPDGSQRLRLTGVQGRTATDRGTISIRGDEICSRWERVGQGQDTCFAYYQLGQSLVAIDLAGAITPTRFELQQGNPDGV
jgi:hypothetical protein